MSSLHQVVSVVCVSLVALAAPQPALSQTGVIAGLLAEDLPMNDKKFLGDPIVFVHGCPVPAVIPNGSGTNYVTSTLWRTLYEDFRSRGYPAAEWPDANVIPRSIPNEDRTGSSSEPGPEQYLNILVQQGGQCGSLRGHAAQLAAYVHEVLGQTGAKKVDIVANSVGALTARWYMKFLEGDKYVRDIVLLAGTNHGTNVALLTEPFGPALDEIGGLDETVDSLRSPNYDGARQASPAYNCDPERDTFQSELNGCEGVDEVERVLGETTEDEAKPSWLNLYNNVVDELHQPTETSCLNQKFPNDCLSDTTVNVPLQNFQDEPHGAYRLNPDVIKATYDHVSRRKDKKKAERQ